MPKGSVESFLTSRLVIFFINLQVNNWNILTIMQVLMKHITNIRYEPSINLKRFLYPASQRWYPDLPTLHQDKFLLRIKLHSYFFKQVYQIFKETCCFNMNLSDNGSNLLRILLWWIHWGIISINTRIAHVTIKKKCLNTQNATELMHFGKT